MTPTLLIDTSYTIFFRYYATLRWYSLSHPEDKSEEGYEWIDNIVFREMFEKKYFEGFKQIISEYSILEKDIIFVRDCSRKDIWRKHFYEEYKSNRDEIYGSDSSKIFKGGPFFKFTYDTIIPNLISQFGCKQIKYNNLEADDIIYLLKTHITRLYPEKHIIIVASDHDLLQLIDSKTTIIDLKNKIINKKSCGNPLIDLELKILCGDKSDNIAGCFDKCGTKTGMKLCQDRLLLKKKFKQNQGSLDIYARNKILIDFNCIPVKLVELCNNTIKSLNI